MSLTELLVRQHTVGVCVFYTNSVEKIVFPSEINFVRIGDCLSCMAAVTLTSGPTG